MEREDMERNKGVRKLKNGIENEDWIKRLIE